MRDGSDMFRINSAVGRFAAVAVEIVDDCGLVENLLYLGRSDAMAMGMRIAKILSGNKGKTIFAQPPVEADADGAPVVEETNTDLKG